MLTTETLAKVLGRNPAMLWYLGSVYTVHPSGTMGAYHELVDWARILIKAGVTNFYSPILHWHDVSHAASMDIKDHDMWMKIDEQMMRRCDGMIVCMMPNYQKSRGLAHEVKFFQEHNKPVVYWEEP